MLAYISNRLHNGVSMPDQQWGYLLAMLFLSVLQHITPFDFVLWLIVESVLIIVTMLHVIYLLKASNRFGLYIKIGPDELVKIINDTELEKRNTETIKQIASISPKFSENIDITYILFIGVLATMDIMGAIIIGSVYLYCFSYKSTKFKKTMYGYGPHINKWLDDMGE